MIKFTLNQKNGTLTVNKEGVKMFHENVMTSEQVANILADGNPVSARELNIRLNSGQDFAIMIPEDRFNKLKFGYGLCDGHNIKIVMYYNLKNQLCFLTYINGHVTTIDVQDGDTFSSKPLADEPKETPVMDTREYRSKLFTLANKIRAERHVSQKEAYHLAKEMLDKVDAPEPHNEDVCDDNEETVVITLDDVFNGIKDIFGPIFNKVANKMPKPEPKDEVDAVTFLRSRFKKLAEILNDLNTIEGELNRFMNNRQNEKRVNPTPPSVNPWEVLGSFLDDLLSHK